MAFINVAHEDGVGDGNESGKGQGKEKDVVVAVVGLIYNHPSY